jgi:RNA polymerase sigma-70 factor (ECF subfamily)
MIGNVPTSPAPATDDQATPAELDAALRELFAEGARAWPEIRMSPEAFVGHLAARVADARSLDGVRAADLYLACACATRVRGAVEAFDRVHLRRVGAFLAAMRPAPAFVDEVRQVIREKLFVGRGDAAPKITEYDGRGALASWVRVVALRVALDLQRQAPVAADSGRESGDAGAGAGDPEVDYLKQRYRQVFNDAFRGAVAELGADSRELLRLHFVDGLTLHQLALKLGVHRATVARRLAAGRQAVADAARRRLRAALGATEAELESLAGMMRSQIDLSLPVLLHEQA